MTFSKLLSIGASVAMVVMLSPVPVRGEEVGSINAGASESGIPTAPVKLDGIVLFRVRGISAYPADHRAVSIRKRIEALAQDADVGKDALRAIESEIKSEIVAGDRSIMTVVDADARVEGLRRQVLAAALVRRIQEAIADYRQARRPEILLRNGLYALAATAVLALTLGLVIWGVRRLDTLMEQRWRRHIQSLGIQSFEIVRAEQLWAALRGLLRGGRGLAIVVFVLAYLYYVLSLFPWTRGLAWDSLASVVGPLETMGQGMIADIPDLVFLAILTLVVRYGLKLTRFFFDAVARGAVTLAGFQPEWAWPTYKIARIAVIAFALVVAYPYIPGSQSAAFKGISLFLGVVFSIGSTSIIANTMAGYALIYRRAFRVGDRVKIGDVVGDVIEMRLQVTHLRSLKNEEVIVPNSLILSSQVLNYSSLARKSGLILHTTVGIGYEVPWRQVEAMLLMAAERTSGLLKDPPPFILQQSLGDFAVNYELNVFCHDALAMMPTYTALHRNILDVFNEYGVQIMTPAYEYDPDQPKVVPKTQWYASPARVEGS